MTSDPPPDVRARAAQAAYEAFTATPGRSGVARWNAVVDAVAEVLAAKYDRTRGTEAVLRDIAAALHHPDDLSEVHAALLVEHGKERATEIMDTLAAAVERKTDD